MAYPYQNLSLKSIKGEVWEDIPGFDGAYHISNYGRIKSLKRWRNAGRSGGYYTKDKILKPRVAISSNHHLKSKTYNLGATLKQDGVVCSISIARLVYCVFVKDFDLKDTNIIISYKDLDGKNLKPSNLLLTNRSELQRKSYELNRSHSHWQENKLAVLQLNMQGELIRKYKSITEAAKKTGFNLGAIAECCKNKIYQHKGYRWQYVEKKIRAVNETEQIFNDYLWRKIGRPKTSKSNPIPVLNLSLKNLKGEKWKPIEGLKNCYEISSLGRVKSLSRFKENQVWLKEHILKLVPDGNQHRASSSLLVTLNQDGRKFQQSVGRLVYYHFVRRFDMSDRYLRVKHRNDCFYDLNCKNIFLTGG